MPPLIDLALRLAALAVGVALVVYTLISAIRTVVVPRSDNVWLTRQVFLAVFRIFQMRARRAKSYHERDALMAFFGPVSFLLLPVVWLALIITAYTLMFWAIGVGTFYEAFKISGSSVYTLGFFTADTTQQDSVWATLLEFSEATIGLGLVALVLAYLPVLYGAFQKRETQVTLLEVRADTPPSAVTLITRAHSIRGLEALDELWEIWEVWFAEIYEAHTSLAALNFFRSPHPDRSWITAAGAVLDAASLMTSAVAVPRTAQAQLCIRSGYVTLRHIADFFRIAYDPDPHFPDPISISREEFEDVLDELVAAGVPILADRDQAWKDFAGWRVNYDTVLLALAGLTMSPYAPWSSDRSVPRLR